MAAKAVKGLEPTPPDAVEKAKDAAEHNISRPAAAAPAKGAGFGPMYSFMRFVGERSVAHFFKRAMVIGGQDIPADGPFILCCTHFSTLMDVAIISAELPHRRPIHYWAKRGLYKRQPFRWILENSGNIQVDRREKNNEALFAGTFEAMKAGEAIGLFPEGGSFTEHRLHSMKAGAAWAALEYAKHLASLDPKEAPEAKRKPVLIVPAAINYTDKSRFRSEVVFEFGKAFTVDEFAEEFLQTKVTDGLTSNVLQITPSNTDSKTVSEDARRNLDIPSLRTNLGIETGASSADEGTAIAFSKLHSQPTTATSTASAVSQRLSKAPSDSAAARSAVRKLTDRIGAEIYKMTIDAPDWTTWHAIKMARELIWTKNGTVPLKNLVAISNALVSILNAPIPQAREANESLCALQGILLASSTDVFTFNAIARRLPVSRRVVTSMSSNATADEPFKVPQRRYARAALPSLFGALGFFLRSLLAFAIRLPYLAPLTVVYGPAYFVGWSLSLRYASHEEESMASAKSLCAFVIAGITHIGVIVVIAALLLFTPPGWILGIAASYTIEKIHVLLLDESYVCFKNLIASWRLLLATAGSLAGPFLPSGVANRSIVQMGGEDIAVQMAVDAVKTHPGVKWSFIKALRSAHAQRNPRRHERYLKQPNRPQSLRRLVERPPIFRVMGVSRAIHAKAHQSLAQLFNELERIARADKSHSDNVPHVPSSVLDSHAYLRQQMQNSGAKLA